MVGENKSEKKVLKVKCFTKVMQHEVETLGKYQSMLEKSGEMEDSDDIVEDLLNACIKDQLDKISKIVSLLGDKEDKKEKEKGSTDE